MDVLRCTMHIVFCLPCKLYTELGNIYSNGPYKLAVKIIIHCCSDAIEFYDFIMRDETHFKRPICKTDRRKTTIFITARMWSEDAPQGKFIQKKRQSNQSLSIFGSYLKTMWFCFNQLEYSEIYGSFLCSLRADKF